MTNDPRDFIVLRNTATEDTYTLYTGATKHLPPGTYTCTECSIPNSKQWQYQLQGSFNITNGGNDNRITSSLLLRRVLQRSDLWVVPSLTTSSLITQPVRLIGSGFPYAVALVVESSTVFQGLLQTLLYGLGVLDPANSTTPYLLIYETDGSVARMQEIAQDFAAKTIGYPYRAFVSGVSTTDFLTALETLPRTVLVISIGSTLSDLSLLPNNGLSMCYNDDITTESIILSMLYNLKATGQTQQSIYIVAFEGSLFADNYIASFLRQLDIAPPSTFQVQAIYRYPQNDTAALNARLLDIAATIQTADMLLYVGNANEVNEETQAIFNDSFPPDVYVYMSDTMDNVDFPFENQRAYIVTASYMDYTSQSSQLYQYLYTTFPRLADYSSFLCPFAFDAARQLNLMMSEGRPLDANNFIITKTVNEYTKAALDTNWVTLDTRRPLYGLFWHTQTKDPVWGRHVNDFSRMSFGTQKTQRFSASNGFRNGRALWCAPNYIVVNVMYWKNVFDDRGNWIFTSQPLQSLQVDTSLPYQNNDYHSSNIGIYGINFSEVFAIVFLHNGKVQVDALPGYSQWPMTIVDYFVSS